MTVVGLVALNNCDRPGRHRRPECPDGHPHPGADQGAGGLLLQLLVFVPATRPGEPLRAGGGEGDRAGHARRPAVRHLQHRHHHRQGRACDQTRGDRLAVFGAIAALAALLIGGQLIERQLRRWSPDGGVLRSLGADPAVTLADTLVGILSASAVGALLAGVVARGAVAALAVRTRAALRADPGIAFDWTVLGFGILALVVVLWTLAVVFGVPGHPIAPPVRSAAVATTSKLADAGPRRGHRCRPSTGDRFALQSDARADSGAHALRHSRRHAGRGRSDRDRRLRFQSRFPGRPSGPLRMELELRLSARRRGARSRRPCRRRCSAKTGRSPRWSGYYFANLQIDGLTVPVLGATPHSAVRAAAARRARVRRPPIRSCSARSPWPNSGSPSGSVVRVAYGATRPTSLRIVAPPPCRPWGSVASPAT